MRACTPLLMLALAGCDRTPFAGNRANGFDEPIGVADVMGRVTRSSGAAPAAGTVLVSCGAGLLQKSVTVSTEGVYSTGLTVANTILGGSSGHLNCQFTASDGGVTFVTVQHSVGFGPPGLPHVMQMVDIHE